MAVTCTGVRQAESFSNSEVRAFVNYSLSGTYVTGGFITPFSTVYSVSPGSSPFISKTPLKFDWNSPLGYIYVSSIVIPTTAPYLPVITTKIFSAPNTELANGTAVPDALVSCAIDMKKY